ESYRLSPTRAPTISGEKRQHKAERDAVARSWRFLGAIPRMVDAVGAGPDRAARVAADSAKGRTSRMSKAFDISEDAVAGRAVSTAEFQVLRNAGFTRVAIQAWGGATDNIHCKQDILNASDAGLAVDIYCFLRFASPFNAQNQVNLTVQAA